MQQQHETMSKRIAVLGSTGSIGCQTLEVIAAHPQQFSVEVLTAHKNVDLLISQAITFQPNVVVIQDDTHYSKLEEALRDYDIKVYAGSDSLVQIMSMDTIDVVLMAIVGFAALAPTIRAIEEGKTIAIANKETFVVAGEFVVEKSKKYKAKILPVDSEHSAILQCLMGEFPNPVEKIILTASGGPFRGQGLDFLKTVKAKQALKHPNWDMGAKITIDSASLMNKGFEMIEAKWLFNLKPSQIDVVVHPQSIIHSMVQFEDGSIKAQMGLPDMKLPIQYAMGFPERIKNDYPRLDFTQFNKLTFEQADEEVFRNLTLAKQAMLKAGNAPCIVNAANEVVVEAFLQDRIGFLQMPEFIEYALEHVDYIQKPRLEDYFATDEITRKIVLERINKRI